MHVFSPMILCYRQQYRQRVCLWGRLRRASAFHGWWSAAHAHHGGCVSLAPFLSSSHSSNSQRAITASEEDQHQLSHRYVENNGNSETPAVTVVQCFFSVLSTVWEWVVRRLRICSRGWIFVGSDFVWVQILSKSHVSLFSSWFWLNSRHRVANHSLVHSCTHVDAPWSFSLRWLLQWPIPTSRAQSPAVAPIETCKGTAAFWNSAQVRS